MTYFIQLLLGTLSLSSLYFKRKWEYPQRQWVVFKYDVSKQIIGMGFAHIINISIAILINNKYKMADECRWYFLNFFTDTTLGLLLNYIMLKSITTYIRRKEYTELIPGEYLPGNSCYNKSFILQMFIWLFIILLSKALILVLILIPFRQPLNDIGRWILSPVSHNYTLELAVIMIVFPLLFNIMQFWIQDNILKGKRHYMDVSLIVPEDIDIDTEHAGGYVIDSGDYAEL